MSWPHILSFSRVVAGPVVAWLVLWSPGDAYLWAAIIFGLASITDLLDGKLARYSKRASPLGVFLDTTSDKVMVSLVLIGMAMARLSPAWVVFVVVGREFLVTGLRSYAASCNVVISAHIWGKGKAAITMVTVVLVLLAADGRAGGVLASLGTHLTWSDAYTATQVLLGVSAVLTIISGIRYVVDARSLLTEPRHPVRPRERPRIVASGDPRR